MTMKIDSDQIYGDGIKVKIRSNKKNADDNINFDLKN
jgi:hypothetical protein